MKSRPRTISAAFFTPLTNGMKSNAVSTAPPSGPLRRIDEASVPSATSDPSHGTARSNLRAIRR
jgi:hypothetical protein